MSNIYSGGVKATAIAAIIAAVEARISTRPDGSKSLDRASLQAWVQAEFADMIADAEYTYSQAASEAMISVTDVNPDLSALDRTVGRDGWVNHPNWPALPPVGSPAQVAQLQTLQATLRMQCDTLTGAYYQQASTEVRKLLEAFYLQNLRPSLPLATTRIVEDRFYRYTWVTDWLEESAPSPVSDRLQLDQNDVPELALAGPPSGRNIAGYLLYRSSVGSNSAAWLLVEDLDAAHAVLDEVTGTLLYYDKDTLTFTDAVPASQLQEACPSLTWEEPPNGGAGQYLKFLTDIGNGIHVGCYGNIVAPCEDYFPFAFPPDYQITTSAPIVAMAGYEGTCVVAHRNGIDYIHGTSAASLSQRKDVSELVCVAPRSMIAAGAAVIFASMQGLAIADDSGVKLLTDKHWTSKDWQALDPTTCICGYVDGTLYFLIGAGDDQRCYSLHQGKLTTIDFNGSCFYTERRLAELFTVQGTDIVQLFGADTMRTGSWKSGTIVMPRPTGFAWLAVESDFEAAIEVKWYGDGELVHTWTLPARTADTPLAIKTARLPVRGPSASVHMEHVVEVNTTARWTSLLLASSTQELQQK